MWFFHFAVRRLQALWTTSLCNHIGDSIISEPRLLHGSETEDRQKGIGLEARMLCAEKVALDRLK